MRVKAREDWVKKANKEFDSFMPASSGRRRRKLTDPSLLREAKEAAKEAGVSFDPSKGFYIPELPQPKVNWRKSRDRK